MQPTPAVDAPASVSAVPARADERARPDVSVIVVTYQSARFVGACLDALGAAASERTFEAIVVDNGSQDGTVALARARRPAVRVVEAGHNAGFARACNIGVAAAAGRHILLLNPDAVPGPGSIARLVALLDRDASIGVTGPQLINPDLTDQRTARAFPTPAVALVGRRSPLARLWPGNPWTRRYLVGVRAANDLPFDVDWMSGACLMVRREAIERVGALDGQFFMYWEDADWCRRMKDAGERVVCDPSAVVVHDEGVARGRPSRQTLWFHRSAYRYYAKHHLAGRGRAVRVAVGCALLSRAACTIGVGIVSAWRAR